ncbi:MAG: hypothetical protein KIS67_06785 [Verrucomicrobiae bacterium]|nr:hypothetical protein [Verrucomicrobiae bacterium]
MNNLHPVRYRLDNPGNDIASRRAELRLLRQPMLSHGVNELTNATRSGTLTVAGLASQPGANLDHVAARPVR